tara:strand:- start:438 stop:830 length:393 start_codon:yes stop_codon:yes gene_type:complete
MEPDYSKYTTVELLEVLESIEHSVFPDRVKQIKLQLAQREDTNEIETDDVELSSEEKKLGAAGQVILIICALYFLWLSSNAVITDSISIKGSSYRYESSPCMFLLILAVYIFVVSVCVKRVIRARRTSKL